MEYESLITLIGKTIDICGVIFLFTGIILSAIHFLIFWFKEEKILNPYREFRNNLSRTILLGLEFLIAGDIIRSIAIPPTFTNVGTLAIIILIRSFLGMQLEKDFTFNLPWNKKKVD